MGKTTAEIIYDFKDFLDKERLSDQIGYSNRFIFNHALNYRALLIKRKLKDNKLTDLNYQTITINLEEVTNDYPCSPGSKCILLRTKIPIPEYISLKSITSPINTSGEVFKFSEIDPDMIKFKINSRLPLQKNNCYYYFQNTGKGVYVYLWSANPLFLKSISIKAIFYQPHIVQAIKDCDGNLDSCFNYLNSDFVTDPDLLGDLNSFLISNLIKPKSTISDFFNDGLETNTNNPQPIK